MICMQILKKTLTNHAVSLHHKEAVGYRTKDQIYTRKERKQRKFQGGLNLDLVQSSLTPIGLGKKWN